MTQRVTSEIIKVVKENVTKVIVIKVGGKVLVLTAYEYRKFREAQAQFDVQEALDA